MCDKCPWHVVAAAGWRCSYHATLSLCLTNPGVTFGCMRNSVLLPKLSAPPRVRYMLSEANVCRMTINDCPPTFPTCRILLTTLVLQIIGPGMGDAYLRLKLGDQKRALQMVADDPDLQQLQLLNSPLLDMEVRGVPALDYFAGIVWSPVLAEYTAGEHFQTHTCSLNRCFSPALRNLFATRQS